MHKKMEGLQLVLARTCSMLINFNISPILLTTPHTDVPHIQKYCVVQDCMYTVTLWL